MRTNFSEHVNSVFAENSTNYDEIKNLMFDLANDELGEGVSKREANEKLREITRSIFGLSENSTKRDRKRAYEKYARDYFDLIEEVVDFTVSKGLTENEWFNTLVNYKNLKQGDTNLFINYDEDVILDIARMGKRHHDTILQRLPGQKEYQIETDLYGAAVGADIDRFIVGLEDFNKMIDAITKAFTTFIQQLIFEAVGDAVNKLPAKSQFVKTAAMTAANRTLFNRLLQDVSVANGNSPVIIMGTQVALQELENLINVNWIANSSKEQVATMGRLGNYGAYQLVEIPQRFKRNDISQYVYSDDVLWIFATNGDDKLVDFVDVGETIIDEITDRGESTGRIDDTMKYEVQREFGCGARVGRYFGQFTIDRG